MKPKKQAVTWSRVRERKGQSEGGEKCLWNSEREYCVFDTQYFSEREKVQKVANANAFRNVVCAGLDENCNFFI